MGRGESGTAKIRNAAKTMSSFGTFSKKKKFKAFDVDVKNSGLGWCDCHKFPDLVQRSSAGCLVRDEFLHEERLLRFEEWKS